jgi:hypothetical protein
LFAGVFVLFCFFVRDFDFQLHSGVRGVLSALSLSLSLSLSPLSLFLSVDVRVASAFLSASSLRSLLDRNSCSQILLLEL